VPDINASFNAPRVAARGTDKGARLRLFCFPYAGAGASVYRAWSDFLPPEIEVVPVQLPGREGRVREAPFKSLAPLIEMLARDLAPRLDVPFAFFGHSMGALIGFELARRLRAEGGPTPEHLFASGRRAPSVTDEGPPLHTLDDAALLEKVRELNGTPAQILQYPELLRFWLPILRADFELCASYSGASEAATVDCPVSAFGGLEDTHISRDVLAAWGAHTRGAFSLRMFPGDHFFLHTSRQMLLRAVAEDLRAASAAHGPGGGAVSV
jgi:surfactin synthase thioesterase subunit